jgi:ABC-type oligopeptide transport system substrate-binding subunit
MQQEVRILRILRNLSILFVALLSFILTSCSSKNRLEGYVYYRLNTNPTTLDPALIVDVTGGSIAAKLFNGLVRLGEDLSVQPDIAKVAYISRINGRLKLMTLSIPLKEY